MHKIDKNDIQIFRRIDAKIEIDRCVAQTKTGNVYLYDVRI